MRFNQAPEGENNRRCVFVKVPVIGEDGQEYDLEYLFTPQEAIKLGAYAIYQGIKVVLTRLIDKLIDFVKGVK